ncbi:hypothetical protein GQ473_04545 [archaeon]|nr:hypothetical protein [archaeon]
MMNLLNVIVDIRNEIILKNRTPKTKKANKKGAMHTIEAFISFFIVISFILTVMPATTITDDTTQLKINNVYMSLDYLEKTGQLKEYIINKDLVSLNTSLYDLLPKTYDFSVGMSTLNATHKTTSGNYTFNYSANSSSLDYVYLNLAFKTAQNPTIYVNGNPVLITPGDVSGTSNKIDITDETINGINVVQLNFTVNTNTNYNLIISHFKELESLTTINNIRMINYLVSGVNNTFMPAELRVYVW